MHDLLTRYLATIRDPASQCAARADLTGFTRWWETHYDRVCDPALLVTRDLTAWVRHRQEVEERQPMTINRGLSTLRRFGAWLLAERLITENPATPIPDVPVAPRSPRALPDAAVDALLRAV